VAVVRGLGVGVHEDLRDDRPRAIGAALEDAQRVVVAVQLAAPDEALAVDDQVGGDGDDVARQHAELDVGVADDRAGVEVAVPEEPTEVLDDGDRAALHRAEGVDPVGVGGVDAGEPVGVPLGETLLEGDEGLDDRALVAVRQIRELEGGGRGGDGHVLDRAPGRTRCPSGRSLVDRFRKGDGR
jgi:hypothetical protein